MRTVDEVKKEMVEQYIYLFKLMREDRSPFDVFFVERILITLDQELTSLLGTEQSWKVMLNCIDEAMKNEHTSTKEYTVE